MDALSATFSALADPTRRSILAQLAKGEATVNELAAPYQMSLPSVSRHLKVLEQAGLITRSSGENDRRTASLSLTMAGEAAVTRWQQVNERLLRSALTELPPASRDVVAAALPALRDLAGLIDALADAPTFASPDPAAPPKGPTGPPPP